MTRSAVAIGGGTGLPAVLRGLLGLDFDVTAVVTVADDGGSSGLLRRELGMLPPGDARNCLVALADPDSALARVFNYRFPLGEGLAGHALGNLIIAALADIRGGFPEALEAAAELLGARGRVLPSTLADVRLHALDAGGREVAGQANVARSDAPVETVYLEPEDPPGYPPAVEAIAKADAVVIGPGSLYTSILPNFLVAGVADALRACRGRRVYVCNVANQRGETEGMDAAEHVRALVDHGLAGAIDDVIVHECAPAPAAAGVELVCGDEAVRERIAALGLRAHAFAVADRGNPLHHSADLLRAALAEVL